MLPNHPEFNRCFIELDHQNLKPIDAFKEIYEYVKKSEKDLGDACLFKKLHLGYAIMSDLAFDELTNKFTWLEEMRLKFDLRKRLNFLETDGLTRKSFLPHIDGRPNSPQVMLNIPIQNCTTDTTTFWVEPVGKIKILKLTENGTEVGGNKIGATPHLRPGSAFTIIREHCFTDQPALFRSDIFHGVENRSKSDSIRVMMHWWFSTNILWNDALKLFSIKRDF